MLSTKLRSLLPACLGLFFVWNTSLADTEYCPRSPVGAVQTMSGVVVIAEVTMHQEGYQVELRERPERVIPPLFDLLCVPPSDNTAQVVTTYTVNTTFPGNHVGDSTYVYDAEWEKTGPVEVPIRLTLPVPDPTENAAGPACGGVAGVKCTGKNEYCRLENCGIADEMGVCATKPEICTMEDEPVCGCDNMRYTNACHAAAAGVNVKSDGECE